MFDNRLPADQLATLGPGDTVTIETSQGWGRTSINTGTVVKLTPKQIVVHYEGTRGTIEARFRRDKGVRIGEMRGEILDPTHPSTLRALAEDRRNARRRQIDSLAHRWSRERDNLDVLRRLHVAVGEYLDAEATQ